MRAELFSRIRTLPTDASGLPDVVDAVFHEGSLTAVSVEAIQALVEVAPKVDRVLWLLGVMRRARVGEAHQAETVQAIEAQAEAIIACLKSDQPAVRAAAAFAVGALEAQRPLARQTLEAALVVEPEPSTLASLLLCRGLVVPEARFDASETWSSVVARSAAVIASFWAGATPSPALWAQLSIAAAQPREHPFSDIGWGTLSDLAVEVLQVASASSPREAVEAGKRALLLRLEGAELLDEDAKAILNDELVSLIAFVARLTLARFVGRVGDPVTRDELLPEELEVLEILTRMNLHRLDIDGFPWVRPEQVARFLGASQGPLDATFSLDGRTYPMWKWLFSEKDAPRVLAAQTPEFVLAVALDRLGGGYPFQAPTLDQRLLSQIDEHAGELGAHATTLLRELAASSVEVTRAVRRQAALLVRVLLKHDTALFEPSTDEALVWAVRDSPKLADPVLARVDGERRRALRARFGTR